MSKKTLLAAAIATIFTGPAIADWPETPVQVVVPWGAGGLADSVARAFTTAIKEEGLLEQPVAVINMDSHFSIGMRRVNDAKPDGSEFLLANVAMMAGEATGVMDFGYRNFEPVAETGESCFIPVVRASSGIDSISGLLDAASGEDPVIVGVNIGANNHVAAAMLANSKSEASFRYTQTGGDTASFTALKGEQINLAFLSAAAVSKFMIDENGNLNTKEFVPLGYMGESRHPDLPDLPTVIEQGVTASFCIPLWWFAPKDTDATTVSALADVLEQAQKTDNVQTFYIKRMMAPSFYRGDTFAARLDRLWSSVAPIAEQVAKSK